MTKYRNLGKASGGIDQVLGQVNFGRTNLVYHIRNHALHLIILQIFALHPSFTQPNRSAKLIDSNPGPSLPLLVHLGSQVDLPE